MIRRYSSRTEALDKEFLAKALESASKYYRIAGYFRSSIFELVGEEIAKIPEVKIVCNSELDALDFQVASGRAMAIKERWNQVDLEAESLLQRERYVRLDQLLKSGNVEIVRHVGSGNQLPAGNRHPALPDRGGRFQAGYGEMVSYAV